MTRLRLLLLILVSCTVMFIGWLILACLYWTESKRAIAYIGFIIAFISVLGQITTLAIILRERQMRRSLMSVDTYSDSDHI